MTIRWAVDAPTRLRLWTAERHLRRADTAALSPEQRRARLRSLDQLRTYRRARQFPRNEQRAILTPVFIDAEGRHCAVAHLMRRTGAGDRADHIAATANLARIAELDSPELRRWAADSGLTTEELARIQPAYSFETTSNTATTIVNIVMLLLIPLGIGYVLINTLGRLRDGGDRSVARAGLVLGGSMVLLGGVSFYFYGTDQLQLLVARGGGFGVGGGATMTIFEPSLLTLGLTFVVGIAVLLLAWRRRRRD